MENQNVSIIVGCMDRASSLIKSIPTWLALPKVTEIIIVDWNSQKPVAEELNHLDHSHVKIIRVNNAGPWVLTLALNVALKYVSNPIVLKLDCDNMLKPNFFDVHPLNSHERVFYTGNWKVARNINERHLNGVLYIPTHEFRRVKGYNEFIRTYGYDDTDLYERLTNNGMTQKNLSNDSIKHIPHPNSQRSIFTDLELKIAENMFLCKEKLWGYANEFTNFIETKAIQGCYKVLVPADLERNNPDPATIAKTSILAMRMVLNDKFGFTWEATLNKSRMFLAELYNNRLNPKLVIEPKNGLGNRLRALASAAVIAEKTGRNLLVVWMPDEHYGSKFNEHFDDSKLCVISTQVPNIPSVNAFPPSNPGTFTSYSQPITFESNKDLYIVSATVLNDPHTNWSAESAWLRRNIQPLPQIQKLIDYWKKTYDITSSIGLHIRMGQNSEKYRFEDWSRYSENQRAAAMRNRNASHYSYFMNEMEKIWAVNPDQTFFLCADDEEIYKVFEEKYKHDKHGTHINHVPKRLYDRSYEQITGAIIDVYLLSMCKKTLGSPWSSYSELVERLGQQNMSIASKDFGTKKFALLCYKNSRNLGDDIQSIAASQFLPTLPDYMVDRDTQKIYDFEGHDEVNLAGEGVDNNSVKIIMNGWFDGRMTKFPPNDVLNPLFVSFHLNETPGLFHHKDYQVIKAEARMADKLLTPDVVKYLNTRQPIGCRDMHSVRLFKSHGVEAYHTSCLTLTLDPVKLGLKKIQISDERREVLEVDASHSETQLYQQLIPIGVRNQAVSITHGISGHIPSYKEKRVKALELLERYYNAKLVITNRIHVALPCIALGTPVLFIHREMDIDPRFDETIYGLLGNGKTIPQGFDFEKPSLSPEVKTLAKKMSNSISQRVRDFIKN